MLAREGIGNRGVGPAARLTDWCVPTLPELREWILTPLSPEAPARLLDTARGRRPWTWVPAGVSALHDRPSSSATNGLAFLVGEVCD